MWLLKLLNYLCGSHILFPWGGSSPDFSSFSFLGLTPKLLVAITILSIVFVLLSSDE